MDALLRNTLDVLSLRGQAPAFLAAIRPIHHIARSGRPVLLCGETGTGKELVARAIHYQSPRAQGPFVPVNCGALAETLLEDELFGHERGAFTDARQARPGLIALAEGGTLFLDEIDSLSSRAQVALLRVLQEHRYRPVGSSAEQLANIRLVTACNAPLEQQMQSRGFRSDLFYRLAVFQMLLPPLRQRTEDVVLLAEYFLEKHAPADRRRLVLSPEAQAALVAHDWPGNVRELENMMIRSAHLCRNDTIELTDLGLSPAGSETGEPAHEFQEFGPAKARAVTVFERAYLLRLMAHCQGSISQAAARAGKDRSELSRLLRKHDIDRRAFLRQGVAEMGAARNRGG